MSIDVEDCYERYGPMVLRRCRKMLGDDEAADAMQDVFVKLVRQQHRLTDRGLSSLLFRMATHECLNRLRSRSRRPEDADTDLLMRIAKGRSDGAARVGARDFLERIFSSRRESTRTIAVLHLLDGMTLEETAREVGMSVSGVRKRLRKLRASLPELEETL